MAKDQSNRDRFVFAGIGVAAGLVVGCVLAFMAAWIVGRFPIRFATIVLSGMVFGVLGWTRGAQIGDALGMLIHGLLEAMTIEVGWPMRGRQGTYAPRGLAYVVLALAVLALLLAWTAEGG